MSIRRHGDGRCAITRAITRAITHAVTRDLIGALVGARTGTLRHPAGIGHA